MFKFKISINFLVVLCALSTGRNSLADECGKGAEFKLDRGSIKLTCPQIECNNEFGCILTYRADEYNNLGPYVSPDKNYQSPSISYISNGSVFNFVLPSSPVLLKDLAAHYFSSGDSNYSNFNDISNHAFYGGSGSNYLVLAPNDAVAISLPYLIAGPRGNQMYNLLDGGKTAKDYWAARGYQAITTPPSTRYWGRSIEIKKDGLTILRASTGTTSDCKSSGGVLFFTSGAGNEPVCRIDSSKCPSGWRQLESWSTTIATYRNGESSTKCLPNNSQSCTTDFHAFGNKGVENCSGRDAIACGPLTTGWTQNATVTQIGCVKDDS